MKTLILACDTDSLGAAHALCARMRVEQSTGHVVSLSRLWSLRDLEKEIVSGCFESVAAMHPQAALALSRLRRSGRLVVPVLGIWSDYTCACAWSKTLCEGYALSHPALLQTCAQMGLPAKKLRVTGIPVYGGAGLSRSEAREKLHLPRGGHLVLIPRAHREEIDAFLSMSDFHPQVVALCADREVRIRLTRHYTAQPRVLIREMDAPIELWLDACNALFTEPKAGILARAAARRVPMVLLGDSDGTAGLFGRSGMALCVQDPRAGARAVRLLCQSTDRACAMTRAQSLFANSNASKNVCDWLTALTRG
ncbi:hypothetical protein [uncultured Ruthenibacterium sp.]|uniref:MGDG synthase family glycosyltransferase n=1 Tax=uncultured Ruthenibacterium sp. TaxID=1905347 RepID=UPI00349E53C1